MTSRQAWIVAHPVLAGYAWGAATVALVLLANAVIGNQAALTPLAIAARALGFAVLAPLWGILTRRAILRKIDHAG